MAFTATKWDTAEDKAKFLKKLQAFVIQGFQKRQFTLALYRHLINMFGHIAHYNLDGFWDHWFTDVGRQAEWLMHAKQYSAYGDPAWTWSDVERAFREWLHQPEQETLLKSLQETQASLVRAERKEIYLRLKKEFETED